MGETTAEAVTEIDQTRQRLDSELRELESYLPAAIGWAKRAVGALVAGGAITSGIVFALRRRHRMDSNHRLRDVEHRLDRIERKVI